MKTINFYKLITLLLAMVVIVSCVQDDEYDVPSIEVAPANITGTVITISALNDLLVQEQNNNGNPVLTFQQDSDLYVSGYVISNDATGNFFEEIIIQDEASSPNAGVKVLVDVNPLYITYEFGRKVFVKLSGLTVGLDSGVLSLGIRNGSSLENIAEAQMFDYLVRDNVVAEIVPMPIGIADFSDSKTNLYVRLNDVQFNRNEVLGDDRKTYAAEPDDQFDGERILESCETGASTVFSTSTFADFKGVLLPQGRGTLDGILTKNFFGEEFNVVINSPVDINFDNTERCDPNEVDCGIAATTGANVLFSDFFETQTTGQAITGNGWTNYIEAGSQNWEAYFDDGTNASLGISARIGSFNSGDASSIGWLISPAVDFEAQDGETLNFKTSNSFADGSTLEVLFSNDWDGDINTIATATWDVVSAATIVEDGQFFGDWISSGNVDLSCVTGNGYIAWKYTGSGVAAFDGTYELDEIQIKSN
jgi:hypothetical protein